MYRFRIPASGKYPAFECILYVIFSSHCISWGPKRGERIDFSIYGEDRRIIDEKGIHRCFDEARYLLSLHLPGIFKTFVERDCLFTRHQNWLLIEIVDAAGELRQYEIFFRITKQDTNTLRVYVESAYVRDSKALNRKPAAPRRRGKVSAKLLMAKTLKGEPIPRPASK